MKELSFELPVGLTLRGENYKNVELLRTNGVAEKIFLTKIAEKPFTWQGNVLAAGIKSIGPIEIGVEVRKKYLEDNSVTIPEAILKLPLAEVNTLLVEIHRRLWKSFIPKQEIICKYCGKKLVADIDLDKIDFPEEDMERFHNMTETEYELLCVDLEDGWQPLPIPKITGRPEYAGITDTCYNRFVFRVPTLEDAIRQERHASDSIGFWRKVAMDCLVDVQYIENGELKDSLPEELRMGYGLKIFNEYLTARDLRAIRTALTEHLPTLPYAYYEVCGCDQQREIPMVMEASSFFSE